MSGAEAGPGRPDRSPLGGPAGGRSPLLRPTDRLRPILRRGLVVALLLAAGVSALVGLIDFRSTQAAALHARQRLHPVEATAVTSAVGTPVGVLSKGGSATATVRWTDAAGRTHQAQAPVSADLNAGQHVRVWLTSNGSPAAAPTSFGESVGIAAALGGFTLLGTTVALVVGWAAADAALTRSNERAWDREWADVEPHWSHRC